MNFYLKILFVFCSLNILSGYVWSVEKNIANQNSLKNPCFEARHGKLDLNLVEYHNSSYYSYLFECTISVTIPYVDERGDSIMRRMKKKLKLANSLLSLGLDVNYKDQHGTSLLMSVVLSYLPEEWKIKTIKILIAKGVNIKIKNIYGLTAMDYAIFRKNKKIIELLTTYSK